MTCHCKLVRAGRDLSGTWLVEESPGLLISLLLLQQATLRSTQLIEFHKEADSAVKRTLLGNEHQPLAH